LCYAKITPAALHRGEFAHGCRGDPETLGRKRKFELSRYRRVSADLPLPIVQRPGWQQLEQGVPDA
jgi:hypothetical protein